MNLLVTADLGRPWADLTVPTAAALADQPITAVRFAAR